MRYREPNEIVTSPPPTLWKPLDIKRAQGGTVNMDYFPVRVRLPEGTDPGRVLNHIRLHINDFVDTSKSEFAPFADRDSTPGNVAQWNSTRPTGSFVTIDIPGPNNGTVGVIDSGRDHWTFATLQSPPEGSLM